MLILTRKVGQKLLIGNIEIMICGLNRQGEAKVGITAPRSVPIVRQEVLERIEAEKAAREAAP